MAIAQVRPIYGLIYGRPGKGSGVRIPKNRLDVIMFNKSLGKAKKVIQPRLRRFDRYECYITYYPYPFITADWKEIIAAWKKKRHKLTEFQQFIVDRFKLFANIYKKMDKLQKWCIKLWAYDWERREPHNLKPFHWYIRCSINNCVGDLLEKYFDTTITNLQVEASEQQVTFTARIVFMPSENIEMKYWEREFRRA